MDPHYKVARLLLEEYIANRLTTWGMKEFINGSSSKLATKGETKCQSIVNALDVLDKLVASKANHKTISEEFAKLASAETGFALTNELRNTLFNISGLYLFTLRRDPKYTKQFKQAENSIVSKLKVDGIDSVLDIIKEIEKDPYLFNEFPGTAFLVSSHKFDAKKDARIASESAAAAAAAPAELVATPSITAQPSITAAVVKSAAVEPSVQVNPEAVVEPVEPTEPVAPVEPTEPDTVYQMKAILQGLSSEKLNVANNTASLYGAQDARRRAELAIAGTVERVASRPPSPEASALNALDARTTPDYSQGHEPRSASPKF